MNAMLKAEAQPFVRPAIVGLSTCRGLNGKATITADGSLQVQVFRRKHKMKLEDIRAVYVQRKNVMQPGAAATALAFSLLAEQFVLMGWVQVPMGWNELVAIQQALVGALSVAVAIVIVRAMLRTVVVEHSSLSVPVKLRFVWAREAREFAEHVRDIQTGTGR